MNEFSLKSIIAVCGSFTAGYLGGWSYLLQALLAFVVVDYLTGVMAAGKKGEAKSSVGFYGICKKVCIFLLVAIGHMGDVVLGTEGDLIRNGIIFFYMANELISLIENVGVIGLPVPDQLVNTIEVLKNKGK